MRILFDGFWWDEGPVSNRSVQRELIIAWREAFPFDQIAVALRGDALAPDLPEGIEVVRTHLWPHALANMVELSRLAARWRADHVVAHNFTPLRDGGVTFVHDAMFVDHPKWFTTMQRMYFAMMLPSARFARVVATSTQSEAERIERHSWPLAPVTAIGVAAPSGVTKAEPIRPAITAGIDGFALTVGRLRGRANVEAAMAAVMPSAKITPRTPLIVVTGTSERSMTRRIPAAGRRLRDAGLVRFAGHVDDAGMSWLYRHAAVALALAHDEAAALPALEATWFDTPLIASDIPAHREVADGWARFVPAAVRAPELAGVIDAAWNAPGDEAARDRILDRARWHNVVRALRAATPAA